MKKTSLICTIIMVFFASSVCATDFSPTQMKITVAPKIHYDFNGSNLEIPVTMSGKSGTLWFLVYTKDKAQEIGPLRNGFLGWHWIGHVDTCLYVSPETICDVGSNTIVWNGKDNAGGKLETSLVPAGEYTYYMFAYDHVSSKVLAVPTTYYTTRNGQPTVQEKDEAGLPLTNPIWHMNDYAFKSSSDPALNYRHRNPTWLHKWTIGNDPLDPSREEITMVDFPNPDSEIGLLEAFDPHDFDIVYLGWRDKVTVTQWLSKYQWVPNGTAVLDPLWGEGTNVRNGGTLQPGAIAFENYLITGVDFAAETTPMNPIYMVGYDGSIVQEIDLSKWMAKPDDYAKYGLKLNERIQQFRVRDNKVNMSSWATCKRWLMDPITFLDTQDMDDMMVWGNDNGDYLGDKHFSPDDTAPWACDSGPTISQSQYADELQFTLIGANGAGAVTAGLIAPDGTGIGWFAVAGETTDGKNLNMFIDGGSAYDGMYLDNASMGSTTANTADGFWYIAYDSIKGTITSQPVSVEENAPAAFSVAQNSPNPFNPTTTISFTLPVAGMVSIDVYNVAGQKVDTIVNEHMNIGSHSVVWDGSEFSAGVYFYTVKTGGFSKTIKMTLLK